MKHTIANHICTVSLQGDIVSTTVQTLKKLFLELLNQLSDVETVVLDLKEVDIVDSQGLNFLIGLYIECEKKKLNLKISHCNSNNHKLLAIFKLDKLFGVEPLDNLNK